MIKLFSRFCKKSAEKEKAEHKAKIGRLGEDVAAEFFVSKGYSVVARNLHISHLEIDLIVEDTSFLVFVEVKARTAQYNGASRYGRPASAVDSKKRARIAAAAEEYLRQNPTDKQPRIDVLEVYVGKDGTLPKVLHIRNAFGAQG
ncbi:MAG: YraN family protein [Clostridia bacterium]|nr:YraN family protein [Clostridia bacterium]